MFAATEKTRLLQKCCDVMYLSLCSCHALRNFHTSFYIQATHTYYWVFIHVPQQYSCHLLIVTFIIPSLIAGFPSMLTCCVLVIHYLLGTFQKTKLFQRAVMFSMLNPQPNGAGFVGFYTDDHQDLSAFTGLRLRVRGQGDNNVYKLNLRHNGQGPNDVAYEAFYEV